MDTLKMSSEIIGIPEEKIQEIFDKINQEGSIKDEHLLEFFHLFLVLGIEEMECNGNDEILLKFFDSSHIEDREQLEYKKKIHTIAKEYIRLTSNLLISGKGNKTKIIKKRKTPIKIENRDTNFKYFFTEYRDIIDKIKQKKSKYKSKKYLPDNPYKGTKRIGLGIESQIKNTKIKSSDIKIDINTDPRKSKKEKYILYAQGWSLKPDEEY